MQKAAFFLLLGLLAPSTSNIRGRRKGPLKKFENLEEHNDDISNRKTRNPQAQGPPILGESVQKGSSYSTNNVAIPDSTISTVNETKCEDCEVCREDEITDGYEKDVIGLQHFSNKLLYRIVRTKDENIIMSGFNVAVSLSMVLSGAEDATRAEIAKTLQVTGDIKRSMKSILGKLGNTSRDEGSEEDLYTLSLAQGVFIEKKTEILDHYIDLVKCYFQGEVANLDQENPSKRVNEFVEKATSGQIKDIVTDEMLAGTKLALVSAIFFKGEWVQPFEEKKGLRFHESFNDDGVKMPFMSKIDTMNYYDGEDYSVIQIPYKGGRFSFYIVLPADEGEVLSALKQPYKKELIVNRDKMKATMVNLIMPKFRITTAQLMKNWLKEMGMEKVFESRLANLNGISGSRLYVSEVIHKAFIQVNEKGTEAGAATVVSLNQYRSEAPRGKKIVVNRPFIFLIQDDLTGVSVFEGIFRKPPKNSEEES